MFIASLATSAAGPLRRPETLCALGRAPDCVGRSACLGRGLRLPGGCPIRVVSRPTPTFRLLFQAPLQRPPQQQGQKAAEDMAPNSLIALVIDRARFQNRFHRAKHVHDDPPQRHEEPRALRQLVIAWRRLQASGAFAANPSVRLDVRFDPQRSPRSAQADARINESNEALNPVQDRLNLQLSGWCFFHTRFL